VSRKKTQHSTVDHNLVVVRRFFKNFFTVRFNFNGKLATGTASHHTLNMSPHYLAKLYAVTGDKIRVNGSMFVGLWVKINGTYYRTSELEPMHCLS